MTQALLELNTPEAAAATPPLDRTGFDIGWDHARHALAPPAELLVNGSAVGQGWLAAKAVFGRRAVVASRGVRQWLALRLLAWRGGAAFDLESVTPEHLVRLQHPHCPVTRQPLGGTEGSDLAPVVVRLRDDRGYVAGNLVQVSRTAARAMAGLSADAALDRADRLARAATSASNPDADGALDAAAWARLATLKSLAVALPPVQVSRIALRLLPPADVELQNPAQRLQVLLTLRLHAAGWSRRARQIADLLPFQTLRHDFNLFVGAIAARLMEVPVDAAGTELHWALEDCWADARVQRRWAQFAVQLSLADAKGFLQRLVQSPLGGVMAQPPTGGSRRRGTSGAMVVELGGLLRSPRRGARVTSARAA